MQINIDSIIKNIQREHEWYQKIKGEWELAEDTWLGGQHYIDKLEYLNASEREEIPEYNARVARSLKVPYSVSIVKGELSYIFSQPYIISNAKSFIENEMDFYIENVNRLGDTLTEYLKQASFITKRKGIAFTLVDKPQKPEGKELNQAEALNYMPYFVLIQPENVINWYFDKDGKLQLLVMREKRDPITYDYDKDMTQFTYYRIWTPEEWRLVQVFNTVPTQIDSGKIGIGEIPIIPLYNEKIDDFQGRTEYFDYCHIEKELYNARSHVQEQLYEQTFAILCMAHDEPEKVKEIVAGMRKALGYPTAAGTAPQYLAPDIQQLQGAMSYVDGLVAEIYRIASEKYTSGLQKIFTESGISKAWEFNQKNQNLTDFAKNIEKHANKINEIKAKYAGKSDALKIDMPDDFDIRSEEDYIDSIIKVQNIEGIPRQVIGNMVKGLIDKLFPKIDSDEKAKMNELVDARYSAEEVVEEVVPEITDEIKEEEESNIISYNH